MSRRRKIPPPKLGELQAIQLTLDLPQTRIRPGSRILDLNTGKTGRVLMWHIDHLCRFPGGKLKSVPRHLLVEIQ
jgi:hypothetical protein